MIIAINDTYLTVVVAVVAAADADTDTAENDVDYGIRRRTFKYLPTDTANQIHVDTDDL